MTNLLKKKLNAGNKNKLKKKTFFYIRIETNSFYDELGKFFD